MYDRIAEAYARDLQHCILPRTVARLRWSGTCLRKGPILVSWWVYLLNKSLTPQDPDEQTALDIARLSGRDDIVDILSS